MPIMIFRIAAAQFDIDCEIKARAISQSTFAIEEEPNCPHLSRLKRSFRADLPGCIPNTSLLRCEIAL
ncbi:hypothetical protein KEU06_24545 [Pseudaminobacter sp. 19-2017]|uniref:Uncharacterized protein n=1 Tax=Pseudaminobacter soli (ex Zhang et al. 2022) TaxID=2831468 RepID=A0A942E613_9HYPH|nr:hypothetical protein [Pseudaminobacter soli]